MKAPCYYQLALWLVGSSNERTDGRCAIAGVSFVGAGAESRRSTAPSIAIELSPMIAIRSDFARARVNGIVGPDDIRVCIAKILVALKALKPSRVFEDSRLARDRCRRRERLEGRREQEARRTLMNGIM